jgi:hypothetical protein
MERKQDEERRQNIEGGEIENPKLDGCLKYVIGKI